MLTGFLAQAAETYSSGPQGINPTSPLTYTPIDFHWLKFDTSGRFDCSTRRWVPVQGCEEARLVTCGTQVLICGGALPNATLVNIKMSQLRSGAEVCAYAGQGEPDYSKPGMAKGQATGVFLCEPGDEIGVWIMINQSHTSNPTFPSPYGLGTMAVDPHWAHTYFWGSDLCP